MTPEPLLLPSNRFPRFYRGGDRIDALRGLPPGDDHRPEDWVGSTATSYGSAEEGLSRLPDGALLRDLIARDPVGFLGPDHVARHGADPALLVKLLDAGERLPVHAHPGRPFSREHLGLRWGKTEAWIILDAEPGAAVHVGPREELDHGTLAAWVERQDADEMLAGLREVPVSAGDALLVPAGTLHAIGEGILLLEVQEPTDLSLLIEWRWFGVATGAEHLDLGWERALQSVDRRPAAVDDLRRRADADEPIVSLLPEAADAYFRVERVRPGGGSVELSPAFSILLVVEGAGRLLTEHGEERILERGSTWLVPHGSGAAHLEGRMEVLRCRPPSPDAPTAAW